MYVKAVKAKDIHTLLLITFLMFNWFSIQLKFWKVETWGFPTIPSNAMYVEAVEASHKNFLCIQYYICQSIQSKF